MDDPDHSTAPAELSSPYTDSSRDPFPLAPIASPPPYPRLDSHRAFAERYVVDFDREAAFVEAGYASTNPEHISTRALQLLAQPAVATYVEYLLQRQAARCELAADQVLAELLSLYRQARAAGEYGTAHRALTDYGKHLGMFADQHKHSGRVEHAHVHVITGVPQPGDPAPVMVQGTETKQ